MSRLSLLSVCLMFGLFALATQRSSAQPSDPKPPVKEAEQAGKVQIITGTLTEKDPFDRRGLKKSYHHVHEIEMKKGEVYLIELRSVDFDAFLRLETAAGTVIAKNDDAEPGTTDSRILYVPRQTSKRQIVVTSLAEWETGEYRLLVQSLQPAGKEHLIDAKFTEDSAKIQNRYVQEHLVQVQAERWYLIDVESRVIDPFLVLFDEKRTLLTKDEGQGSDARLLWPSGKAGHWFLRVVSVQPRQAGEYTIRLRPFRLTVGWELSEREVRARNAMVLYAEASGYFRAGNINDAFGSMQRSLRMRQELYPRAKYPDGHPDLGRCLSDLGIMLALRGQDEQAQDYANQALKMRQMLYPAGKYPDGHPELADALDNLGRVFRQRKQNEEAQVYHTQALMMRQKLYPATKYPDGHHDVADSLHNLGMLLAQRGEYEQAQVYFDKVVKMLRKLYPATKYPDGHRDLAANLALMAQALTELEEYEHAQEYSTQALKMSQRLYPTSKYPAGHPALATCLSNEAVLYQHRGQDEQAQEYHSQALKMTQRLYPTTQYPAGHPDLARSLLKMAGWLKHRAHYEQAQEYSIQALKMREKLYSAHKYPDGHPDLAASLGALGALLFLRGEYEQAEEYNSQELKMYQKLYPATKYPNGHPMLANSLSIMGESLRGRGQDEEAQEYHTQALKMRQKLFPASKYPDGHYCLVDSLSKLGALLHDRGEYERGREYSRQALKMSEKLYPASKYPNGHALLVRSLYGVGIDSRHRGQHEQAQEYFSLALNMCQKLYPASKFPDGHPELVKSLNNLGELFRLRGQYDQAQNYCNQALNICQKLYPASKYPNGHRTLADSLGFLGELRYSRGHYDQAQDSCKEALKLHQKLFPASKYPDGHPKLANSLNRLSVLLRDSGQYDQALEYRSQSLNMSQKLYPPGRYPDGHHDLAANWTNMARLLHGRGQYEEAQQYYSRALRMHRRLLNRQAATALDADALLYTDLFFFPLSSMLSNAQHLNNSQAQTYAIVWASKAPVSRLLAQRQFLTRVLRNSSLEMQKQHDDLIAARRELDTFLRAPVKDVKVRDDRLTELNAIIAKHQNQVSSQLPTVDRLKELDKLNPDDLAKKLPTDAVFIDFVRYTLYEQDAKTPGKKGEKETDSYLAFILTRDGKVARVELGPANAIHDAVFAWRKFVTQAKAPPAEERKAAAVVAKLIWEPLRPHLPANVKTVYLAPDEALHVIPWAALPGLKKDTFLLEEVSLAVVPHGPFLLEQLLHADKQKPASPASFLALGGVHYGKESPGKAYLAGTAFELDMLRNLTNKKHTVTTLEKTEATVDAVRKTLPKARFAHLATHGYFKEKDFEAERDRIEQHWQRVYRQPELGGGIGVVALQKPMSFVGLVLAGAEEAPDKGRLSGETIIDLDLEGMELCVLSACRTGEGRIATRGEGVAGLVRAFHIAGCRDVVASLWSVSDPATAVLMEEFYSNLLTKKLSKREALRQAQLKVLRQPELVEKRAQQLLAQLKKQGISTKELAWSRDFEDDAVEIRPKVQGVRRSPPAWWAAFILSGEGR